MAADESSRFAVLVVDAYAPGRRAICAVVAELGYRVHAAATASEARRFVEAGGIDLIVADADQPDLQALMAEVRPAIPCVSLTVDRVPRGCRQRLLQKPTGIAALSRALCDSLPH